jgi:hypothetical protein
MNQKKQIVLLLVLCLGITAAFGQTPKQPKTIYEFFHLKPGGCKLSGADIIDVAMEAISMVEYEEEKPNIEPEDLNKVMAQYKPLFKRNSETISRYQKPRKYTTFKNGNFIYAENNLYGLKNMKKEIIIPAKFHTLIPDGDNGFVAFENQFCNYYSNMGQKILKTDYYYIKHTPKNTFIVQTDKGYGVISADNKFIIQPGAENIDAENNNGKLYYWIEKNEDIKYYLSENLRDTFYFGEKMFVTFIDADYWKSLGRLINVKTKKYLICESDYSIDILNPKYHIASITENKTQQQYLINFNGNLINTKPFKSIYPYYNRNITIAGITMVDEKSKSSSDLFGIINLKGAWVVKPQYLRLDFFNDTLIIAQDKTQLYGIISTKNKIIVPFKYNSINKINESIALGVIQQNGEYISDVIHLPDNKIIKSGLPYYNINETELCGNSIFIGQGKKLECALNENFEALIPKGYYRIFYGPDKNSFLGKNFTNGDITESHLFDCKGNIKSFNINGKEYNSFIYYNQLSEDLYHLLINNNTGYFVTSKGKTVFNNSRWQDIEYSNAKDLYMTMIFGGKYGIINSEGETVIPTIFEYISPFDTITGLARYNYDDLQKGFITSDGELLFGTEYLETNELGFGLFQVMKNKSWGVVNQKGEIIVPVEYSSIKLKGGTIWAKTGSKFQVFDIKGNQIGL